MKKILYLFIALSFACSSTIKSDKNTDATPNIFPDYKGVIFPANIAPINFTINESGDRYYVEITSEALAPIKILSRDSTISIPMSKWRKFRQAGADFQITVFVENNGKWTRYAPIDNHFSKNTIDSHLVYRKIAPGYITWSEMGIYERNLSDFSEEVIADNRSNEKGCMNCHTFQHHNPEKMMLHIRKNNPGTIITDGSNVKKVDMKVGDMVSTGVYPAWHPTANFIAYSSNNTMQIFHATGIKPIDVVDTESDLVVYDINENIVVTDLAIFSKDYMETFPDWSADGKYIYFCRANKATGINMVTDIRYNLCRIPFDVSTSTFGDVEVLFDAISIGKSVSFPKNSPTDNYLIFTLSDYGNFSVWHPESDLYLLNTETLEVRPLDEINSNDVDSYHSWSSDGRYLAISSKRIDGLWSRPFFAEFNDGVFSKPFLMPQENPSDYERQLYSYNIPNFITGKVPNKRAIRNAVAKPAKGAHTLQTIERKAL